MYSSSLSLILKILTEFRNENKIQLEDDLEFILDFLISPLCGTTYYLLKLTSKLRPKGGMLMEHHSPTLFVLSTDFFCQGQRGIPLGIKEWEKGEGLRGSPPSVLTDGSVTSI